MPILIFMFLFSSCIQDRAVAPRLQREKKIFNADKFFQKDEQTIKVSAEDDFSDFKKSKKKEGCSTSNENSDANKPIKFQGVSNSGCNIDE